MFDHSLGFPLPFWFLFVVFGYGFCFFGFCSGLAREDREFRGQKSSLRWLHSPFYNGECRVSVKRKRDLFKKGSNRAFIWKVFE